MEHATVPERAPDSRSSESSHSLTPPQSRIPLSSSVSNMSHSWGSRATVDEYIPNIIVPDTVLRAPVSSTMNKDACYTYVHMHQSHHADLFEDFCKDKLPTDDIYVPPNLQPINPEEEDDVVPDQHAAYGVQKATQKAREPAWKDLGLSELLARGPPPDAPKVRTRVGPRRTGGPANQYKGLPR